MNNVIRKTLVAVGFIIIVIGAIVIVSNPPRTTYKTYGSINIPIITTREIPPGWHTYNYTIAHRDLTRHLRLPGEYIESLNLEGLRKNVSDKQCDRTIYYVNTNAYLESKSSRIKYNSTIHITLYLYTRDGGKIQILNKTYPIGRIVYNVSSQPVTATAVEEPVTLEIANNKSYNAYIKINKESGADNSASIEAVLLPNVNIPITTNTSNITITVSGDLEGAISIDIFAEEKCIHRYYLEKPEYYLDTLSNVVDLIYPVTEFGGIPEGISLVSVGTALILLSCCWRQPRCTNGEVEDVDNKREN
ncbi:MAG: hypothetical protein GSR79_00805 [Desulfurococcales archaeon]|nr:hypothetical protein [Desulfurococcales archaeon]